MNDYIHARIGDEERAIIEELREETGETASALVKQGLLLLYKTCQRRRKKSKAKSALEIAGKLVGKYCSSKYTDLSTNKKHMKGYGE